MSTVTELPYYPPTRNRHYRGCQDNQPWFTEPRLGLHLGLEALAMRLSRCWASQPITGEQAEKDDIIGKLGQMQLVLWLSCPPACFFLFHRHRYAQYIKYLGKYLVINVDVLKKNVISIKLRLIRENMILYMPRTLPFTQSLQFYLSFYFEDRN